MVCGVNQVINQPCSTKEQAIENALPELRVKYIVILYQDSFDNWYASVKPQGKESIKISVQFYLSRMMRNILDTIANIEFKPSQGNSNPFKE